MYLYLILKLFGSGNFTVEEDSPCSFDFKEICLHLNGIRTGYHIPVAALS